ncbi:uncharacterized protein BO97DRAFT_417287 [Aspergillus homomorphus CBS 101889]|uniref:Uncharacterized protein n=1 Tax=Aspergillus homomorphus (strain CBS 101889) TaxID=1450537 RepID=A0A395HLJ5_ASPHC|nr:hypothetical protein BO97DRAFT_417287 [Aspergillus homomorphus CBS 101889]RAL08812.1 hypothetical protein BO97DRAFT_417287 [Aspergillus homomorphus CBS 101889]
MEPLYKPNPSSAFIAAMAAQILDDVADISYVLWGELSVRLAGGTDPDGVEQYDKCSIVLKDADMGDAIRTLAWEGFQQCVPKEACPYAYGDARLEFEYHLHTRGPGKAHDGALLLYRKSRVLPDVHGVIVRAQQRQFGPGVPYLKSSDRHRVPARLGNQGTRVWRGLWPVRGPTTDVLADALLHMVVSDIADSDMTQASTEWPRLLGLLRDRPDRSRTVRPEYQALWTAWDAAADIREDSPLISLIDQVLRFLEAAEFDRAEHTNEHVKQEKVEDMEIDDVQEENPEQGGQQLGEIQEEWNDLLQNMMRDDLDQEVFWHHDPPPRGH